MGENRPLTACSHLRAEKCYLFSVDNISPIVGGILHARAVLRFPYYKVGLSSLTSDFLPIAVGIEFGILRTVGNILTCSYK